MRQEKKKQLKKGWHFSHGKNDSTSYIALTSSNNSRVKKCAQVDFVPRIFSSPLGWDSNEGMSWLRVPQLSVKE